ncbi:MAG: permease [Deltaproteobacteria bacterium]|nr:MAG: permease [Deltaproteobacteria bacterium]
MMILPFLETLKDYIIDVAPSLALGLFLSGLIHEFVPEAWMNRYLNRKGILPIFYITVAGIILPLCCFGSLPVAIGFRKKGVPLGPILAFLVATPATSVTAILVTWRLMGIGFTLYLCLSVVLMGLVIGLIGNLLPFPPVESTSDGCHMCEEDEHINHHHHEKGIKNRVTSVLSFGFIDIPKEIGLELTVGLILAAVVASITPLGNLIQNYLVAGFGYLFALIFGLIMYFCSTASVPLVHAFVNQGLNIGAGLVLLLIGPITSYGTILVIRKEFGNKILLVYLGVICSLSLILGYLFSVLIV